MKAYANANNELKLGIINRQSLFSQSSPNTAYIRTTLTFINGAGPLFEAINKSVRFLQADQVRKLGLSHPKPGEEPQKFAELQPERQEHRC